MRNLSKVETHSLLGTIDRLSRCKSADKFEDIFKRVSLLLPYEMSLCVMGNSNSLAVDRLINNKFPQDYLDICFTPEMIRSNPFVRETLLVMRPRFWNTTYYKNKSAAHKKIMSTKMDIGLNRGISSAFSEANGKATLLCLSNPIEKPHRRHLEIVDFLMPHLHHTINRIYGLQNGNGNLHSSRLETQRDKLTMREAEVMKWVAEGKTNWEIAEIMTVSEATVKFHLLNIFKKLDVVNRGHAVANVLQTEIFKHHPSSYTTT